MDEREEKGTRWREYFFRNVTVELHLHKKERDVAHRKIAAYEGKMRYLTLGLGVYFSLKMLIMISKEGIY